MVNVFETVNYFTVCVRVDAPELDLKVFSDANEIVLSIVG